MENFFVTENMAVGYDKKILINNIHIHFNKGEILTLIGPNGGGKSTILKTISKQIAALQGNIWIGGKNITELSGNEVAKKIAVMLTQKPRPEKWNCKDVVSMGRYPHTGKFGILSLEDKMKVQKAMELVNIVEFSQKDFNEISDGQRQRVLLACAACQEPEMIVLDEPTTFLDIKYKLELLSILKKMAKEKNIAVVLSLHELDLAQKISDKVLCIKNGKIEKQGVPDEILKEEYICKLYNITEGRYNSSFGNIEMKPSVDIPKTFVIAGGGSGITVFRQLQRKTIPFITGILHENDVDYALAKMIANTVIAEKAFEAIGKECIEQGKKCLEKCESVICCLKEFGTMNYGNYVLLEYAKKLNLPIKNVFSEK